MVALTASVDDPVVVKFHADICWLGPIMGVPTGADPSASVTIAGAEDPALGKAFVAALVPVIEDGDGHFRTCAEPPYEPVGYASDRNGWFSVTAKTGQWASPAEGVLLVLLYNQSVSLAYYTYQDFVATKARMLSADEPKRFGFHGTARVLGFMPEEVAKEVDTAMKDAIEALLELQTAETLRKGLAEIHPRPARARDANPELVFAVASCQYPSAMLEGDVAGASYDRLAKRLKSSDASRPQFLLLVGDQIYVDGTAGLFDPTSQFDRFVRPYEILYRMKPVREVLRQLPAYMMLDDHEIRDNWEPRIDDKRADPEMMSGRRSYFTFQRRVGPDRVPPVGDASHPLWYAFDCDGLGVFMADTRTERSARTALHIAPARIMSKAQMANLLGWLRAQPAEMPKVVATPSILLPRHARTLQRKRVVSALRSDGWDGYPRSLHEVLTCIAAHKVRNVVFVSGDEHLACVARVVVEAADGEPVIFHSVHSSPLFAPFPFANSVREDLVAHDRFLFRPQHLPGPHLDAAGVTGEDVPASGHFFRCRVDTKFAAPGDGFAMLRFVRENNAWTMRCDFDRAGQPEGSSRIESALT